MIYFLKCAEFIKIGFVNTEHIDAVRSRVQQFEIGNPFEIKVLAVMAGSQAEEYRLHKRFYDLRVKGEWFRFMGNYFVLLGMKVFLKKI